MVWGLFPVDPLPGEDKYYIFSKGTYKVGRKGCDIIVNKDKGVSRVHAEVLVDVMTTLEQNSRVRLSDCSKFGTFIKRKLGNKEKVHDFPDKEATIKDGDLVSFGTGNATYRFCFVPFKVLVFGSEPFNENQLQQKLSSIGASMTGDWSPDCSYVLVNQFMELTEDLVDPFVTKKHFVLAEWVEVIAGKTICTEIPSCDCYSPNFMLEGVSVKVSEAKSRENSLKRFIFLLEAIHKYKFKNKLLPLMEMVGAKVVFIEEFCSHSQVPEEDEDTMLVLVIPFGMTNNYTPSSKLSSLSRIKENDVICAAFSGHLDPCLMVLAPVVVSSSCSTDETIVADSDVEEIEAVTSLKNSAAVDITIPFKDESIEEIKFDEAPAMPKSDMFTSSNDRNDIVTAKRDRDDKPEFGNVDVIYSQMLIVRDTIRNSPASIDLSCDNGVPNFKCFRKSRMPSGNSFNNLIPYAKNPYKESDYGSEVVESVKEEKKRKQMEAMAEEMFNNDKARKRGVSGSLTAMFSHGR